MIIPFLIAIGLNFDTFSVAIVEGSQAPKQSIKNSMKVGVFFGIGQAAMALLGVFLGLGFKLLITNIDHWVAFILLSIIGGKLMYESNKKEDCTNKTTEINLHSLLPLVIATSIDAVAVGITLAFINNSLTLTVALIGGITFLVSFIGYYCGKEFKKLCKTQVKTIGGIILILIGLKILIQHLFFGG